MPKTRFLSSVHVARLKRLTAPALLALALCALAARAVQFSRDHPFPFYDEAGNLDQARGFAQEGGLGALVRDYATGRCLEDYRHPLYLMALTPFMRNEPADFARAKIAGLACALLVVVSLFLLCRRLWGENVALAAAAAAALAPMTAGLSQNLTEDVLFAALYGAAILTLGGFGDEPAAWTAFGFLSGLAYLAKGDGHFLLLAALAVGLWRHGPRFLRGRSWLLALGGFAAGGSFLFVRNVLVWGNPFHNANTRVVWLDDWTQVWRLSGSAEWSRVGASWYFQRHDAAQAVARFINGIRPCVSDLLACLAVGPRATVAQAASSWSMAGLSAVGLRDSWRRGRREYVLAVLVPGAALFCAFVWFAKVSANPRHLYPIAVSLFPAAALGARALYRRWKSSLASVPDVARAALAVYCVALVAGAARGPRDPRTLWRVPPGWGETSRWIARHVDARGYLIDDWSIYSNWDAGRYTARPYPMSASSAEVRAYVEREKISAAVVDMHLWKVRAHDDKYGALDAHGPTSFLGWPRCGYAPEYPSAFLTFARNCSALVDESPGRP